MQTEEEFAVFQSNILELGQINFQLRDELKELKNENVEYQKLKSQVESLEKQGLESKERHNESLKLLNDEIAKLQEDILKVSQEKEKQTQNRIQELKNKIEIATQNIQEKEEVGNKLRSKLQNFDEKKKKYNQIMENLEIQKSRFLPMLKFLKSSRMIPMHIEDLSQQICILNEKNEKNNNEIKELNLFLEKLRADENLVDNNLKVMLDSIESNKANIKESEDQLKSINLEIEETENSKNDVRNRISEIEKSINKIISKRTEFENKNNEIMKSKTKQLQEEELAYHNHNLLINEIQKSNEKEMSSLNEKAQSLRKKINFMKETGKDPDSQTVSEDLENQIKKVKHEQNQVTKDIAEIDNSIKLLDVKIEDLDFEFQSIILKMKPTPEILADPNFQINKLLFQELVIQNRELRFEIEKLTDKINELNQENQNIKNMYK